MNHMRVAILHDYLNQYGGAERVLEAFLELFPEADLFTLLYDAEKTRGAFERNIRKTSFLDNYVVRRKHRAFIPLMPLAARLLKYDGLYDLVLSSSAGYGKGIGIRGRYHISYCHSPLRYAWEIDYLKDLPFTPWPLKEVVVQPIAHRLRAWDRRSANRVNLFLANSNYIAKKVRSYYGRDATVIYPPVDTALFRPDRTLGGEPYYLMVGRLLYYKRFELGIQAFNQLRKRLLVVGRGPEAAKLAGQATSRKIEFIPYASDDDLRVLYSNAQALIFPQIEDFGLVAAEAQACGTPVLAYRGGGAEEIVVDGTTGLFFNTQRPEAIVEAVRHFETMELDRTSIRRLSYRFSKEEFRRKILGVVRDSGCVQTV